MAKQMNRQIDEDFMKEIISQGLPAKHEISPKQEEPEEKEDAQTKEPAPKVGSKQPIRKKRNIPEGYKETYFQKMELIDRQPVYVSRSTHEKLLKIVTNIGGRKATVSSYVEMIILGHFEQHQDEINELYQRSFGNPV